jgi:hypothetical protein
VEGPAARGGYPGPGGEPADEGTQQAGRLERGGPAKRHQHVIRSPSFDRGKRRGEGGGGKRAGGVENGQIRSPITRDFGGSEPRIEQRIERPFYIRVRGLSDGEEAALN